MKPLIVLGALALCAHGVAFGQTAEIPHAAASQEGTAVQIQIDAAKTKGALRPVWRYFGADEPNYAYTKDGEKLLGELGRLNPGQVFFRTHHLLITGKGDAVMKWGSTNVYTEDAQGNAVYDWTILDRIFDTYKAAGIRPYVQIGFMPKALSSKPEPYENHWARGDLQGKDWLAGWSSPPKDYAKWGELVCQWAKHCAERYGAREDGVLAMGSVERTQPVLERDTQRNSLSFTTTRSTASAAPCRRPEWAGSRTRAVRAAPG